MKKINAAYKMAMLMVGLSLPLMGVANPAVTSTTTMSSTNMNAKSTIPPELVPMKIKYKDAQGNMKETGVYVPAKKVDELKKAKKVELYDGWQQTPTL